MKIYLTLGAIPVLKNVSADQRRIAYYSCRKKTYERWQTWVGSVLAYVVGSAVGVGILFAILEWSPFGPIPTFFAGGFLCGAVIIGVSEFLRSVVINSQIGPYVLEYLAEHELSAKTAELREGTYDEHDAKDD